MGYRRTAIDALVRGTAYRVTRGLPWWLAAIITGGIILFGR